MVTGVVPAVVVVMPTGYVVVSVGCVHVDPVRQAVAGAVVAVIEPTLPLVENVPPSASVLGEPPPVLNCVAEMVTFQPGAVPVASSTRYDCCAAVGSTSSWLSPFTVPLHPRALGGVRVRVPEVIMSVPVIVQDVPAGMALPQAAASAVPPATRTGAPTIPASTPAPRRTLTRLLIMRIRFLIVMHSPPTLCYLPYHNSNTT